MSSRSPERSRRPRGDRLWRITLVFGLLLGAVAAQALPEDRSQPIHISADKALRDEKQGFTVYEGNVRMQQGSLQITAQRLTVFHQVEEADRILAEGNPAHMQQRPEPEKSLMHARGKTIEYFKSEERVLLRENASVEQDGSKVTGDSIEYLIDEQLIRADSEGAGGDSNGQGKPRVEVVIEASRLEGDDEDTSAADAAEEDPDSASVGDEAPAPAGDGDGDGDGATTTTGEEQATEAESGTTDGQ